MAPMVVVLGVGTGVEESEKYGEWLPHGHTGTRSSGRESQCIWEGEEL